MANNVYTYISFEGISDKASDFLTSIEESDDETKKMCRIKDIPNEGESTEDKVNTYDWYIENIGAKWMYMEDVSEYGLALTSAWSSPIAFCDALFKKLQSLDSPDILMWCRYDDEMPNFIGVYGRYKELDWDECVEDDYYKECVGDTPYNTITNEDGEEEHEWSDTWYDSLDTFCNKEYEDFKSYISEWKEYEQDSE